MNQSLGDITFPTEGVNFLINNNNKRKINSFGDNIILKDNNNNFDK